MGFINAMPGAIAQGLIWGLFAIGLYISYKILDIADLTVDGSICTGACVLAVLMSKGVNVYLCILAAFLAGAIAGAVMGLFHTAMGIPPILSGILTQLILWSVRSELHRFQVEGAVFAVKDVGIRIKFFHTNGMYALCIPDYCLAHFTSLPAIAELCIFFSAFVIFNRRTIY
jgi:ribose/xylose/arabinose/galactoside ABC-type transport system permease subunit